MSTEEQPKERKLADDAWVLGTFYYKGETVSLTDAQCKHEMHKFVQTKRKPRRDKAADDSGSQSNQADSAAGDSGSEDTSEEGSK